MGPSQEPHNMLVMKFDCSSVLSGYSGHLGNFIIIVVEFRKVRAQAVGYITFRHFSVCVCARLHQHSCSCCCVGVQTSVNMDAQPPARQRTEKNVKRQ